MKNTGAGVGDAAIDERPVSSRGAGDRLKLAELGPTTKVVPNVGGVGVDDGCRPTAIIRASTAATTASKM